MNYKIIGFLLFLSVGLSAEVLSENKNNLKRGYVDLPFDNSDVLCTLQNVADWQLEHFTYSRTGTPGHLHDAGIDAWTNATFYLGLSQLVRLSDTSRYNDWLCRIITDTHGRLPANFAGHSQYSLYHADELCMARFYLDQYELSRSPRLVASVNERIDWILAHPVDTAMDYHNKQTWTWSDALFMAPPVYARLAQITGNTEYIRQMDRNFRRTYTHLYDTDEHLFYRDDSYLGRTEANGRKIFWGRGNGWVAAGLVGLLEALPSDSPYRSFYEQLFNQLVARLISLQGADGSWHASLLDPDSYPAPETSATALITYALAYGLRTGLFSGADYTLALTRAWHSLCAAIDTDGKLGWTQPIGADPKKVTREMSATYGVGAFLLAGSELYRLLIAQSSRQVHSFNDGWSFCKGPFMAESMLLGTPFVTEWESVKIPHTWNNVDMQTQRNNYYAGPACYQKTFVPDHSLRGKRLFLRFEGVGAVARVYVNQGLAIEHRGAYSAFAVEITSLLDFGRENTITVFADNTPRPDVIPVNNNLFGVYGGIYRPVQLIVTDRVNIAVTDYASPGVYIDQYKVTSHVAEIAVRTKLENRYKEPRSVVMDYLLFEADGTLKEKKSHEITLSPQGRQTDIQPFTIRRPHLWQGLDDPYLYRIVVRVKSGGHIVDEITQPLGLRHFELRAGDGMYLNGRRIPMYGVCRHQDWWQSGSALTPQQHDTDLSIIRELGATTIRLAHYQQSEYVYSRCDSIGFLVWAEIPFVNRVSTHEAENAKEQLRELIRQNYNHPSIYVWGVHNEVYGYGEDDGLYTDSTRFSPVIALTTDLHDLAKTEDPARLTVSVNGHAAPGHGVNMNTDIQGINRYFGWYERRIQDLEPWIESMERDYPGYRIMLTEYGAEANPEHQEELAGDVGDCCGFDRRYTETFATRSHEIQWGIISRHPYLLASYVWNTFDFATPASSQGGVEARNMKGLVTFDRQCRKDPFYWYKANWSKDPVLYITQRRVVERRQKHTPVTVYSNVGIPRLFVNEQEVTGVIKGTTSVHYIFPDVELKEGDNQLNVRAGEGEKAIEDTIYWHYSGILSPDVPVHPREKEGEHVGL